MPLSRSEPAAPFIHSDKLLFPAPMPLYPTGGSLKEVLELGESRLPITNKNELHTLLMTYHNTLLAQIGEIT
jgi:hypothetical protein